MSADDTPPYLLTATQALTLIRTSKLTVENYASSLLGRIKARDEAVQAWAYLEPEFVMAQARALDKVPMEERGPLHGLPVACKDVMYTKDMPTRFNSSIYKDHFPQLDSASIIILRHAGALIFGKTTTTEFAATTVGPKTHNPNSPSIPRTPGGSSAGSGASVADFQSPLALATQTGGSVIRPASFNGIYGYKPTWGAVSREGQKLYSYLLDTLGWYGRCVKDLELLAGVFGLEDDEDSEVKGVRGLRVAVVKTSVWPLAGKGTVDALARGGRLLTEHGAVVTEVELPEIFNSMAEWHTTLLHTDGRATFLPEYRTAKEQLHPSLSTFISHPSYTRKQQLTAQDSIAALRPIFDKIASDYDVILTPSVVDEAPLGLGYTGDAAFCAMWTALHVPVVNVPGFKGESGMPVGLTLVAGRFRDRHLLKVAEVVGEIFEGEGGWMRTVFE